MKLTAISPCYQEIRFIQAWLENCRLWADEVIISEGGSTDGTEVVIREYAECYPGWIRVKEHPQDKNPQVNFWNESQRRNALVEGVSEGYMVACDVDEMLPDDARARLESLLTPHFSFSLVFTHLWRSRRYIRIGVPGDEHWGPIGKMSVFPAGSVRAGGEINHTQWLCDLPRLDLKICKFHLHYLFDRPKVFENRLEEARGLAAPVGGIRLALLNDELPSAMRFLSETINYGSSGPEEI